jgi:hypothetical protein
MLKDSFSNSLNKGLKAGILYGISQFILYITFGILFYAGTVIKRD